MGRDRHGPAPSPTSAPVSLAGPRTPATLVQLSTLTGVMLVLTGGYAFVLGIALGAGLGWLGWVVAGWLAA